MKILAFDSTAKAASVAVTDGKKLLALYTVDNGLTQSELLLPMIESALNCLKLSYDSIELIATSVGPGSFTGVRIGAALLKGLAFGRNIPCAEVSTLEALAENVFPLSGIIVPCMDARRDQLYTATFSSDGKTLRRITEDRAISIDTLAEELSLIKDENIYLVGDGYGIAYEKLTEKGVNLMRTPELLITENAYSCAVAALKKYERGEILTDLQIKPTYLRLPQAERERLMRESEKQS